MILSRTTFSYNPRLLTYHAKDQLLVDASDGEVEEGVAAVVLQVEALGAQLVDEERHEAEVERADDEVRRRLPRPVHLGGPYIT